MGPKHTTESARDWVPSPSAPRPPRAQAKALLERMKGYMAERAQQAKAAAKAAKKAGGGGGEKKEKKKARCPAPPRPRARPLAPAILPDPARRGIRASRRQAPRTAHRAPPAPSAADPQQELQRERRHAHATRVLTRTRVAGAGGRRRGQGQGQGRRGQGRRGQGRHAVLRR